MQVCAPRVEEENQLRVFLMAAHHCRKPANSCHDLAVDPRASYRHAAGAHTSQPARLHTTPTADYELYQQRLQRLVIA